MMPPTRMPDSTSKTEDFSRPIVDVRELSVDFSTAEGDFRAIDGVSIQIRPRQTLGIVGESGCGKSVTAQAIMRIEDEHICRLTGEILLRRDEEVTDLVRLKSSSRALRRIRGGEIGLIFQEPMTSFSPVHTIGNQIVEAVRIHRRLSKSECEARAIEQFRSVGMPHPEHVMSQYAWELSGGLRQRAMIAMALVCGPRLLIADEPTTALDVTTQAQVLKLLDDLRSQTGMALILITHDLGVVAEAADEVVIMYLGRIVERGSVTSIFENPMHPYTRLLLESLPSIVGRRSGPLRTIEGTVPRALNRPPGCPFHTRCPDVIAGVCDRHFPIESTVNDGHVVNCHLYEQQ